MFFYSWFSQKFWNSQVVNRDRLIVATLSSPIPWRLPFSCSIHHSNILHTVSTPPRLHHTSVCLYDVLSLAHTLNWWMTRPLRYICMYPHRWLTDDAVRRDARLWHSSLLRLYHAQRGAPDPPLRHKRSTVTKEDEILVKHRPAVVRRIKNLVIRETSDPPSFSFISRVT